MAIVNCSKAALPAVCDLETVISVIKPPLISSETKRLLEPYIHISTFIVTSLLGVVANSINIAAYWRQGLKDSITLGFFALSLSDLFVVMMPLITASCYASKHLLPDSNYDFPSIHYVTSGWLRNFFYSMSASFIAMLSIERCCCVVLPFKVKMLFSRSRTSIIILAIFIFHLLCFLPIFATHKLQWMPKVDNNGTVTYRFKVAFLTHRKEIELFNSTLMGIVLPTCSQVVLTVCAVILIRGLKKSSLFRKSVIKQPKSAALNSEQEYHKPGDEDKSKLEAENGGLSKRDARLVKTMVSLVIIYTCCNVPFLMMNYARRFVPDLNVGGAYQNTFSVSDSIVYILTTLNATANIFVYYHTGTKFRETVREMFGLALK